MAKRITIIGIMILVLIGLKATNPKQQKQIERAHEEQQLFEFNCFKTEKCLPDV